MSSVCGENNKAETHSILSELSLPEIGSWWYTNTYGTCEKCKVVCIKMPCGRKGNSRVKIRVFYPRNGMVTDVDIQSFSRQFATQEKTILKKVAGLNLKRKQQEAFYIKRDMKNINRNIACLQKEINQSTKRLAKINAEIKVLQSKVKNG